MRIYFARHGESEANVVRVIANRGSSYPLTGRGRAQARALAEAILADLGPTACRGSGTRTRIHASPLARAMETAAIVASVLEADLAVADALREVDCGVVEGRSGADAWAAHDALDDRWAAGAIDARIEGGESLREVRDRFVPFVRSLIEAADRPAAIVCVGHGALYRWGLPSVLVARGGSPVAPPDMGQAEALVTELDADGRLALRGRLTPASSAMEARP